MAKKAWTPDGPPASRVLGGARSMQCKTTQARALARFNPLGAGTSRDAAANDSGQPPSTDGPSAQRTRCTLYEALAKAEAEMLVHFWDVHQEPAAGSRVRFFAATLWEHI